MKKWTRGILLALAAVLAAAVFAFASGENVLISLSYLTGTYYDQLVSLLSGQREELDGVYDNALVRLEDKLGEAAVDLSWTVTDSFETVYPQSGETVTLSAGSGLVWHSGTGAASSTLIDVTTGEELAPSGPLTPGHRYLAEQETVVTVVSASSCGVEGRWKTTATGSAPIFEDVAIGAWYYDAVLWAVESGVTTGYTTTSFAPDLTCTRGQGVTFLWRAYGESPVTGSAAFSDVVAGSYYADAVLWAVGNGITNGTNAEGTTFSPDGNCTRGQIVTFLWRAAGCPEPIATSNPFTDVGEDAYYYKAVLWAVENGVTNGTNAEGTTFSPDATCIRSEIVTFLYRYFV